MLHAIILEGQSLSRWARHVYGVSPQALSKRLRRQLRRQVTTAEPRLWPAGPLILLADALWFRFRGQFWGLYLMALKAVDQREATFVDPILLPGREAAQRWQAVFNTLAPEIQHRICALITDDLRGMPAVAAERGWNLQLCHFHLISQLHGRRGRRQTTVTFRPHREVLYRLVRRALELPNGPELQRTIRRLRRRVAQPYAIGKMGARVREFLRRIDLFRTYRQYPAWQLPTTTGTVEAMAHRLRSLTRRLGNLRTPEALQLWATILIRMRPTIICNGKDSQPNLVV